MTLTVDRTTITVAERIALTLTIDTAPSFTAEWASPQPGPPEPPDGLLGDLIVVEHLRRELPPTQPDRALVEHTFVLEPMLDGAKTIPAIQFRVVESTASPEAAAAGVAAAPSRGISTQPITIGVASLFSPEEAEAADKAETTDVAPAREPIAMTIHRSQSSATIAIIAGTAGAVVLGAVAWMVLASGRRRMPNDPVADARRSLAEIRATLESGRADPFGTAAASAAGAGAKLAATIREYLQRHLGIAAIGATASELAAYLSEASSRVSPDIARDAASTLLGLEMELFAPGGEQPRVAVLLEQLDAAERLVDSTAVFIAGQAGVAA